MKRSEISLKQEREKANGTRRASRVLAMDASNPTALNNIAYYLAPDNPDEALKFAQQAAEISPGNAAVQDTLGWVYYRKQLYSMAVKYLKTAVDKEPTPQHRFHLGMSYLKSGEQALGQRTLGAALLDDPGLAKTERDW